MSRLNGFQSYKPKERSVQAVKFASTDKLKETIGAAFVKALSQNWGSSCPDPGAAECEVYNVLLNRWEPVHQGDYIVVGKDGEYSVWDSRRFDDKYEHYVTRDQGFTPRFPGFDVLGTAQTAGPGVNRGTHVDSPRVGGLSGGSCRA